MDYAFGALLVVAPWLLGFAHGGAETWVPVAIGVAMIGGALFTDYELGMVRTISMPVHLGFDAVAGAILAVSPWLFGFAEIIWWPHVLFGLLEIGGAMTTETRPADYARTSTSVMS
jgi:hypothetical protein